MDRENIMKMRLIYACYWCKKKENEKVRIKIKARNKE